MPYRDAAYAAARMIANDEIPPECSANDPMGQKELPA